MRECSKVYSENLVEWAEDKPEVVVLSAGAADFEELELFRRAYPARYFSMGTSAGSMVSTARGFAEEGFIPLVHSYAASICLQAFGEVSAAAANPVLPIRIVGFVPGREEPGTAGYRQVNDVALMRSIENMTILECGDETEVESVLHVAHTIKGPVYVRMHRSGLQRLFSKDRPMCLGEMRILSEGSDLVLFSSGTITLEARRAVRALQNAGVFLQHIHISTLKQYPDDKKQDEMLIKEINKSKYGAITVENHSTEGGLGTIIAEKMAEAGNTGKLYRIGPGNTAVSGGGPAGVVNGIIRLSGKILGIKFDMEENEIYPGGYL